MTPTTTPPTILGRAYLLAGTGRRPSAALLDEDEPDGPADAFVRVRSNGAAPLPARARRRRAGGGGRTAGEQNGEGGGQERWLLSYADMITLLVAFFIMLYAMASQTPQPDTARQQFQDGVRSALLGVGTPRPMNGGRTIVARLLPAAPASPDDATRRRLFGRIAAWIARRHLGSQVRLEAEPGGVVLRLDSGAMLFDTGTAALRPTGTEIVDALQNALAPEVAAGLVRAVRVGGHTDDRPVTPGSFWVSNWQLSAARAAGVAARLAGRGGPALAARLEATGYGESRPVTANENENGRRRNRRVEIRIVLASSGAPANKKNEKHHE